MFKKQRPYFYYNIKNKRQIKLKSHNINYVKLANDHDKLCLHDTWYFFNQRAHKLLIILHPMLHYITFLLIWLDEIQIRSSLFSYLGLLNCYFAHLIISRHFSRLWGHDCKYLTRYRAFISIFNINKINTYGSASIDFSFAT